MVQENLVEQIVREVLKSLQTSPAPAPACGAAAGSKVGLDPARDYPLATKRPEIVKTPTGKSLDDIKLESVLKGEIGPQDVRITPETLEMQAEIAEKVGRPQFARNLRRAAELTQIPDERILEIYQALRPYRSTKEELLAIADELEQKYGARINAALVREAAEVYERRGRLRTA
ncbi:diol dehydratase small subunit [Gelria sp. Kuro-4]|uniref:diol dehydratase small subunit n=1 Tax=Gelria sp. Kuro-4 TaxID=2796927 RepID=UPI001BED3E54|nr:diol dehydratase small subunit [Gelria sp. Kuro-4]MDK2927925.1 glycerol dehydratase small subunit [Bacillota bacterium]BCV25861.1 propanediol dehydratase small subunit [Gelria sp. Kuro-4]